MIEKIRGWLGKKSPSPAGELSSNDAAKSIRTAAISAVALAVVTFLGDVSKMDLGPYGLLAVPLITGVIDCVMRWSRDNTQPK